MLLKPYYFFIIGLLLTVFACKKLPNDGIPTYIKLEKPTLVTSTEQGAAVHEFSDIWLESEGLDLGAYEYPRIFAAYLAGEKKVIANAGIYYKASENERRIYAALEPYDTTVVFVQKDTVTIQPVFKYRDIVDFLYVEDFENSNNFSQSSRTELNDANNQIGKACKISLTSSENKKTAESIDNYAIASGKRVFLEFSIKSENYGGFGFKSVIDPSNLILLGTFAPFDNWTTTYFEITNFINVVDEGSYDIFIEVERGDSTGTSSTYIDNIKILQF